jgi:hypothetical protein
MAHLIHWFGMGRSPVAMYRDVLAKPDGRFQKDLKQMQKAAAALPEGELKDAFNYMNSQTEVAYYLLKARQAFKKAADGGLLARFSRGGLEKALNNFTAAAERNHMPDSQRQAVLLALRKDPKSTAFEDSIEREMGKKIKNFSACLKKARGDQEKQVRKALPAPAAA